MKPAKSPKQFFESYSSEGIELSQFYIVRDPESGYELIHFWLNDLGPRLMIIEDQQFGKACRNYLRSMGVKVFGSDQELLETAKRENWPNWNRFLRK